jgi:hypothetical protein
MTGLDDLVAELEARSATPPVTPGLATRAEHRGRRIRRKRRLAGAGGAVAAALAVFALAQNVPGPLSLRPAPPATRVATPAPTDGATPTLTGTEPSFRARLGRHRCGRRDAGG